MTIYNWSTLTNNQPITFDPSKDKLVFDDASISAASVSISFGGSGSAAYTTFAYAGITITLASAEIKALTSTSVTFADGSLLIIGDNTTGTSADDSANTLNGSSHDDRFIGLGGGDAINGNDGDDFISIGYTSGSVGNDVIDGGAGKDTLAYVQNNAATPAITVNMANHSVTSTQGTLTVRSIEKVYGTANNDTFIAGAIEHKIDSLGNITNEIFRGNGGNDTITGVADTYNGVAVNNVDYRTGADYSNNTSAQAINANLHTGVVNDGLGGTDTLTWVSMVFGGAGDDVMAGGSLTRGSNGLFWEMFRGNGGNDTLNGANSYSEGDDASSDRADYSNNTSAQAINVNLVTGKVSDGLGGTDTLIDINQVWGGAGDDTFLGGAGKETFDGGAGSDTIDGGGGSNRVAYQQSTSGVIVNVGSSSISVNTSLYAVTGMSGVKTIAAGTANDGMGGTDVLRNITNVNGSDYSDYLRGTDIVGARSLLAGYGGDNYLVGGAGIGVADYSHVPLYLGFDVFIASLAPDSNGKVLVNNRLGGTDTLLNIKGLAGTHGADSLTGGAGDEVFRGNGGDDTIDGGAGNDWVFYSNSPTGVDVNLATGLATDGWNGANGLILLGGTDHLSNIENAEGSNYADKLTGNGGDNLFRGLLGDDTIDGGAGNDTAYYSGAKADYVITKLADGSYTVRDTVAGRDGTDTLANVENVGFSDGTFAAALLVAPVRSDFNGDRHSDILLNNVKDGSCYVWEMNGLTFASNGVGFVGWAAGAAWQAKATGDFNGDGRSDILLQNSTDGACYVWEMNGLNLLANGTGFVGWAAGANWQAKATGDFNGDGKSDILLQNSVDGACYVWEMDGLGLKAGGNGFVGWAAGANWQVKGTGDFNADGKSDILLQNVNDGACYVWEMDGLGLKAGGNGYVGWTPGADWKVAGTGDVNGDGKSDILLQNAKDGACYVWEMDGLNLVNGGAGFVGWAAGADWHAVA